MSPATGLRKVARSGPIPAVALAVATAATVVANGVSVGDTVLFAMYVTFAVALPGLLWVRLLRNGPAYLPEDLALGLCLGYCFEMAFYLLARAANVPRLGIAWALITVILFGAVPSLRRHWRGSAEHAPLAWSWGIVLVLGGLLAYSVVSFFTSHPVTGSQQSYVDMAFHLAMIGELRNHVPPVIPYVASEPLAYHWFFYVEAAATSWATGIEPLVLLYRLEIMPMLAAFVVLTAVAARRLTGSWWSGLVAVLITLAGTVAAPYAWVNGSVFDAQTLITTWTSPTTVFGLALFAGLLLVLVDRFTAGAVHRRRDWVLAGILIVGASGAKASILPILAVGLVAVVVVSAIARRRIHRDAAIALGIVAVALSFAAIVLYRGSSGGVRIGLDALRRFPAVAASDAAHAKGADAVLLPLLALALGVVLWAMAWAGMFGLLRRLRITLSDPRLVLIFGVGAGALGAISSLLYPGLSELYYARSAVGVFGIASAAGLAALFPGRPRPGPVVAALGGTLAGGLIALAVPLLGPSAAPTIEVDHLKRVAVFLILPVALFGAALVVGAVIARRLDRQVGALRGAAALIVVAMAIGFSLPAEARVLFQPDLGGTLVRIPADGILVARWLRDHSDPGDLVATNMHCISGQPGADCDARHFWVSGYSERRVLVEGWAYTTTAVTTAAAAGVSDRTVPFWDPTRLSANDLAFSQPSAASLGLLRSQYGVTWLFADLATADGPRLGQVAQEEFRSGEYAVYRLP